MATAAATATATATATPMATATVTISGAKRASSEGLQRKFIVNPQGSFIDWWHFIVVLAFIYNLWVLCYRFAFSDINDNNRAVWFALDYGFADCIYAIDIFIGFRTAVLLAGVFQKNLNLIKVHYMNSTAFYLDCSCLLPLDFLYFSFDCRKSLVRINRLIKVYKFWNFVNYHERHARYPILLRAVMLLHNMFVIIHWNGCVLKFCADLIPRANASQHNGLEKENSTRLEQHTSPWTTNHECYTSYAVCESYIEYLYWSTTLLTVNTPNKHSKMCLSHHDHYLVLFTERIVGLLFCTFFLATFSSLIASLVQRQRDYHDRLDTIKRYMGRHKLPHEMQDRVIRWVDYLWSVNQNAEETSLCMLPEKFRTRILMHVYRSMLRKVGIFKHIEPQEEFLGALVLRLNPALFIPGEIIYRRGDVGRVLYFVNQGTVEMLDSENNVTKRLHSGSYFGEEDILCMKRGASKRRNTFRSEGYSYLLSLSKPDFWDVLRDYPVARILIEAATFRRIDASMKKRTFGRLKAARSKSASVIDCCQSSRPVPAVTARVDVHAQQQYRRYRQREQDRTVLLSERKSVTRSSNGRLSVSLDDVFSTTLE